MMSPKCLSSWTTFVSILSEYSLPFRQIKVLISTIYKKPLAEFVSLKSCELADNRSKMSKSGIILPVNSVNILQIVWCDTNKAPFTVGNIHNQSSHFIAACFFISILALLDVVSTLILPLNYPGMFTHENTLSPFKKYPSSLATMLLRLQSLFEIVDFHSL
jgi:hypothetical protein